MTSLLQRPQGPTEAVGQILGHSQADNYVRFLCAVSMLRNCSERHAHEPLLMEKFREQIDVQRLYPVIENDKPVIAITDFPYGPGHLFSIRKKEGRRRAIEHGTTSEEVAA